VFEVVVLALLSVKDVDNHVSVIQRHPLTIGPTLFAKGSATRQRDHSLNFLTDCAHLAVISTRDEHQKVKGVNELAGVENNGVLGNLLGGGL
jgi:hypothetical protein